MIIDLNAKQAFFDTKKVHQAIDRQTARAMVKSLSFIRRRWRSSLRRRKRVSKPGQTPSIRSTDNFATLKNILFLLRPANQVGIVGVVGIGRKRSQADTSDTVPSILESGGVMTIREESWDGRKLVH